MAGENRGMEDSFKVHETSCLMLLKFTLVGTYIQQRKTIASDLKGISSTFHYRFYLHSLLENANLIFLI